MRMNSCFSFLNSSIFSPMYSWALDLVAMSGYGISLVCPCFARIRAIRILAFCVSLMVFPSNRATSRGEWKDDP